VHARALVVDEACCETPEGLKYGEHTFVRAASLDPCVALMRIEHVQLLGQLLAQGSILGLSHPDWLEAQASIVHRHPVQRVARVSTSTKVVGL
jgi:hypothetical protein